MHYLIDEKNKIVFGHSAKCACSHLKKIFAWYAGMNFESNFKLNLFSYKGLKDMEHDVSEYTLIYFIRNPYKRAVSSFVNVHHGNHKIQTEKLCLIHNMPPNLVITYSPSFISYLSVISLLPNNSLEHHHAPQTREKFIEGVSPNKVFDIESIDYDYLNNLYGKTLPDEYKGKVNSSEYQESSENNAYISYHKLPKPCPNYRTFYTPATKELVERLYEKDFKLFKEWEFDYSID